jgi:urease accessory protein
MLTVNKLIAQGRGLAPALVKRAATLALDWDLRQKSRFEATDSAGRHLGVFLPRGTVVRGGDVLVADDGSLVRVSAAPQPVLVVRHCTEHGAPSDLLRAAYHLGNRHVAVELKPDHLKLEPDHVLAGLLKRMHLIVHEESSAFEPESGAYEGGGHDHGHHDHGHHEHAHDDHAPHHHAAHGHEPHANHPHEHGPGHRHDHGHEHGHGHGQAQGHEHGHGHDHGDDHHHKH